MLFFFNLVRFSSKFEYSFKIKWNNLFYTC